MKRIIFALALVLGLSVFTMAPAQAGDGAYSTGLNCETRSTVKTCVRVEWSKQADGDGVRLEFMTNLTPENCDRLETDGDGAYNPVRPFWFNPRTNAVDYQYEFGREGCVFTKDVSNAGSDQGCMDLRWSEKARVDGTGDHYVYMGWKLCPGGGDTLLYSYTVPVQV